MVDKNLRKGRRRRMRVFITSYKLVKGCKKCGYRMSGNGLDFHHTDDNKEFTIADAARDGASLNRILEEMQKCEVICKNCHAEEHDKHYV